MERRGFAQKLATLICFLCGLCVSLRLSALKGPLTQRTQRYAEGRRGKTSISTRFCAKPHRTLSSRTHILDFGCNPRLFRCRYSKLSISCAARRFRRMRSRTIVFMALFAVVALALPLIINRHGSETNSPATKVPEQPKRPNSVRDSQAQSPQPLPTLQGNRAKNYLKEHGRYVRLQNLIDAAQYQIDQQPQENNAAGIYEATNPAQNLRARFNGRDVVLQPLTNKRMTRLEARLSLRGYGYGRRMLTAGAGTIRVDGNRIEIVRRLTTQSNPDEIVEWYQNRKDGLEQGFTLTAPPGKKDQGTPLRVRLTVTGEVRPALVDSGKALELISANGKHWLR